MSVLFAVREKCTRSARGAGVATIELSDDSLKTTLPAAVPHEHRAWYMDRIFLLYSTGFRYGLTWTRNATELKRRINSTLNYPKKKKKRKNNKGSLLQRPAIRMCLIIFATSRKVALISLNSTLVARALHLDICLSMDQFKCNRYN